MSTDPARGWLSDELAEEFPGLAIHHVRVETG